MAKQTVNNDWRLKNLLADVRHGPYDNKHELFLSFIYPSILNDPCVLSGLKFTTKTLK